MSLRLRSTVAAAAAALIAVVVLGSAVDVLVARHLHRTQDRTLRSRAVEVAQLAASAPALLTTPGSLDSPVGAAQAMVEVIDRNGRIVARSLSLRGRALPASLADRAVRDGVASYGTVELDGDTLRTYAAPIADVAGAAGGGAVIVGASTADVADTIRTLHALTLLSGLAAALIGAVAVALLMRRALQPLARLAGAAAEIERTGDARRRLPAPVRRDEVGRLAATLNAMLASLERARDSERRFLADASHELRTPLTALRGNVAHLARHGATPELIDDLEADADRLARLADDLLALSREEAAPPPEQEVRLDELARSFAAPDVDLRVEPATVLAEPSSLERALSNLVENARRHGPPGGRIGIGVENGAGLVLLTVEDEGRGLAPADAERAFERFWRAGSDGGGSGLGLAIVRATAERHGGRVTVSGARFTLELPALRKPSESVGNLNGENPEKGTP
jgi:two-component system, OmpR family, sensor kinase